jgi:hypothetical protein
MNFDEFQACLLELKIYKKFQPDENQVKFFHDRKAKYWDYEILKKAVDMLCHESTAWYVNFGELTMFYYIRNKQLIEFESRKRDEEKKKLMALKYQKTIDHCDKQVGDEYNPEYCPGCIKQDNCKMRGQAWMRCIEAVRFGMMDAVGAMSWMYQDKTRAENQHRMYLEARELRYDEFVLIFPEHDTLEELRAWASDNNVEGY